MASISAVPGPFDHAAWDRFSASDKQRMLADDRAAATRVSLILTALVATGMILAAVTVVVVWVTI